jgi:hypothetical protein
MILTSTLVETAITLFQLPSLPRIPPMRFNLKIIWGNEIGEIVNELLDAQTRRRHFCEWLVCR